FPGLKVMFTPGARSSFLPRTGIWRNSRIRPMARFTLQKYRRCSYFSQADAPDAATRMPDQGLMNGTRGLSFTPLRAYIKKLKTAVYRHLAKHTSGRKPTF